MIRLIGYLVTYQVKWFPKGRIHVLGFSCRVVMSVDSAFHLHLILE